jgi:hypothetical protein
VVFSIVNHVSGFFNDARRGFYLKRDIKKLQKTCKTLIIGMPLNKKTCILYAGF